MQGPGRMLPQDEDLAADVASFGDGKEWRLGGSA
jgi:hypothetical protein